ncbi:MAG: hypothetical protein EZS28_026984, partial [Streblomastix strix]
IEEEEAEERDMILRDAEILSRLVNAKRTTIQLARDALFRKHSQKHAYNEHIQSLQGSDTPHQQQLTPETSYQNDNHHKHHHQNDHEQQLANDKHHQHHHHNHHRNRSRSEDDASSNENNDDTIYYSMQVIQCPFCQTNLVVINATEQQYIQYQKQKNYIDLHGIKHFHEMEQKSDQIDQTNEQTKLLSHANLLTQIIRMDMEQEMTQKLGISTFSYLKRLNELGKKQLNGRNMDNITGWTTQNIEEQLVEEEKLKEMMLQIQQKLSSEKSEQNNQAQAEDELKSAIHTHLISPFQQQKPEQQLQPNQQNTLNTSKSISPSPIKHHPSVPPSSPFDGIQAIGLERQRTRK